MSMGRSKIAERQSLNTQRAPAKDRIAFVGHIGFADFYGVGGMQSYMRRLAIELAHLGRLVDYLVHGAPSQSETSPTAGITIRYFRSLEDAFSWLASGDYEHVVRVWLSRRDRARYVRHVWTQRTRTRYHHIWFIVPDSPAKRALGLVEGLLTSRRGHLVCVSPRQFERMRWLGRKSVLLLPPVPESFFMEPEKKPLRWPLRITFLGVLHPDKGIKDVVRLFLAFKHDPRFKCMIYASHNPADPQQVALHRQLTDQQGLGYVPMQVGRWSPGSAEQVRQILHDTDIFIQPYQSLQNTVDTPLLVLEAMATSCGVMTTPIGSIPELYGNSQFVIPMAGFAGRAEEVLKGLSLEDLTVERNRVYHRVQQLQFSAREVAQRFVKEVLEGG